MSCTSHFRELLPGWAADELDPSEARSVQGHLEECQECRLLAEELRRIRRDLEPIRDLNPPADLEGSLSGSACSRWRRTLFTALDGELPEEELPALLEHLDDCSDCSRVWTGISALRQVGTSLVPSPGLALRCQRIPWAARRQRIPGARAALAMAYVLAVAVSLLLGNPVAMARREVRTAADRVGQRVETHVQAVEDEGRGELRLLVWRIWRMGERTATAVQKIFETDRPKDGRSEQKGETT